MLRHDAASRQVEVASHPLRVDLKSRQERRQPENRAAGKPQRLRECRPFRLPAASRPLVFLDHRPEQDGDLRVDASHGGEDLDRIDRVVLLWQCRRRTASRDAALGDLADLGLREEDDVQCNLPRDARRDPKRRRHLDDPSPRGMPG